MKRRSASGDFDISRAPAFRAGRAISRLAMLLAVPALLCPEARAGRTVLSLDGTWQIAEGGMATAPVLFERTAPVPGLVSLATPPF